MKKRLFSFLLMLSLFASSYAGAVDSTTRQNEDGSTTVTTVLEDGSTRIQEFYPDGQLDMESIIIQDGDITTSITDDGEITYKTVYNHVTGDVQHYRKPSEAADTQFELMFSVGGEEIESKEHSAMPMDARVLTASFLELVLIIILRL